MKFHTREGEGKAVLFTRANKDLDEFIVAPGGSGGLGIDVIEKTPGERRTPGRLAIVIELRDGTTSEELKKAIPIALEWRNRLNEYQGLANYTGVAHCLYRLEQEHRGGKSYQELAEEMNAWIGRELSGCFKEVLSGLPKDRFREESNNWEPWRTHEPIPEHTRNMIGYGIAWDLLWKAGYQKDDNPNNGKQKRRRPNKERMGDIAEVVFYALKRYQKGQPLFDKGCPLDGPRIETTLKAFRRSKEYRIIREQMQKPKLKRKRSGKN